MPVYISNYIIVRGSLHLTLNRHLSDLLMPKSSFKTWKLSSLFLINVTDFSDSQSLWWRDQLLVQFCSALIRSSLGGHWIRSCESIVGEEDFDLVCLKKILWGAMEDEMMNITTGKTEVWWKSISTVTVKGIVPLNILFLKLYVLGLEIVQGLFLSPRLGQKVLTKRNFGLKWLLALKGTPETAWKFTPGHCKPKEFVLNKKKPIF